MWPGPTGLRAHLKNDPSMSKGYFSYVRVSTQRQGQQGTSLIEQTAAIDRYAKTWNLEIVKQFEERETAAKTGRPVFLDMVKALKRRDAAGVLIHKIDRSARNLRDWSELGSLIDLGIEVHFVNESIDLNSRGGRLSADIQAVVASDYIRNLREETIKGIHGRIKQGLYPFPAPPGYRNEGPARPKTIDPVDGPLVKQAFDLYATCRYSLVSLAAEMSRRGLRGRAGGTLTKNVLNQCLRNPFYAGLVTVRTMTEVFVGQHTALINKKLFDRVQDILDAKKIKKTTRHLFAFRRTIRCGSCSNSFVGERQKGHVYYRCHTRGCTQKPIKEESVTERILEVLKMIEFSQDELSYFEDEINNLRENEPIRVEKVKQELALAAQSVASRLERLADAYMDGVFDRDTYASKKNMLIGDQARIKETLAEIEGNSEQVIVRLMRFLELAKSAYLSYKVANDAERRELVEMIVSNVCVNGNSLSFKLNPPFDNVAARNNGPDGCPIRDTSRTFPTLLSQLLQFFYENGATVDLQTRLLRAPRNF